MNVRFEQLQNDLFWNFCCRKGHTPIYITWQGYDDEFWWQNVATSDRWQIRGKYRLNPFTDEVTVLQTETE